MDIQPVLISALVIAFWIAVFLLCRRIERTETWERISARIGNAIGWMWVGSLKIVLWLIPSLIVGVILALLAPWWMVKVLIAAWVVWTFLSGTAQRSKN